MNGSSEMAKQQNTEDFFERTAKLFGSDAILIPGGSHFRNKTLNKIMKNRLIPILTNYEKKSFLEIGSGIGRWSKIISQKNFVTGVDVSRYMVQEAKKSINNEQCFFIVADACNLPFKDDAFDVVISITVLQHILDQARLVKAISEISRCSQNNMIIVEEMWSKTTFNLDAVHYPIKISSTSFYIKEVTSHGYKVKSLKGLTFAPLAILLVKFFVYQSQFISISFKSKHENQKKTTFGTKIINLALGCSLILDLIYSRLDPKKNFNSRLSLHTLIHFKKHQK
ncbi:MAG: class I SAM-dependent methyltransferase [Dehalococcoidia bacterium]|nr:MAG: class I SAM-dependent methyltransferase [Dehalococcoidia bacterium]